MDLASKGTFNLDRRRNEVSLRSGYDGSLSFIGAGTIGSKVLQLMLPHVNCGNVTIWDCDIVESHNIANQAYGNSQIGTKKVLALAELVAYKLSPSREELLNLLGNSDYLESKLPLSIKGIEYTRDDFLESNVVVVAPDTMSARDAAVNCGVLWGPDSPTDLIIEVRLGEAQHRNVAEVFFLDPKNDRHQKLWQAFYFSDDDAPEINPCDKVTVDSWSWVVSGYVVMLFEKWLKYEPIKPYYHMVFGEDGMPTFTKREIAADVLRPNR
jgi:hypothetical protein